MNLLLKQKTVFVSASGQGIGKEIAHIFLLEGARVLINDHNALRLRKTYNLFKKKFGGNVIALAGDAMDKNFLEEAKSIMLKKWKRVDVVVPNLGSGVPFKDNNLDMEEWQRFFNVNVKSVLAILNVFFHSC